MNQRILARWTMLAMLIVLVVMTLFIERTSASTPVEIITAPTSTSSPQQTYTGELILSTGTVIPGETILFLAHITPSPPSTNDCSVKVVIQGDGMQRDPYCLYDDGVSAGDLAANDQIYSAFIPITVSDSSKHQQLQASLTYQDQAVGSTKTLEVLIKSNEDPKNNEYPKLLVLTDWQALYDEFRDTGMQAQQENMDSCSTDQTHDFLELVQHIETYATTYSGIVVDIPHAITSAHGFPKEETTKEYCQGDYATIPYGALGQTGLIHRHCKGLLIDELIATYGYNDAREDYNETIENIVLIGDDQVIPFFRVKDSSDFYGESAGTPEFVSPERFYMRYPLPYGRTEQVNPVLSDMNEGYIMSDVPYSMLHFQPLTFEYNWRNAPDELLRPHGNMVGIGRVFAPRPCQLIQTMQRYQKPLNIDATTSPNATAFLGENADNTPPNYPSMQEVYGMSHVPFLSRWFQNALTVHDAEDAIWNPQAFFAAFQQSHLLSWIGLSDHTLLHIASERDIRGLSIDTSVVNNPEKPIMLTMFGNHAGTSVSNYPDTIDDTTSLEPEYSDSIVRALVSKGVTLFAPTSYIYVFGRDTFTQTNTLSLHQRMMGFWLDHAQDYSIATTGQLWKQTYVFYTAFYETGGSKIPRDPAIGKHYNSSSYLLHSAAAYSMVHYGLPTQPLHAPYASLCSSTAIKSMSDTQAATSLQTSERSARTIHLPLTMQFEQQTKDDGTTLFQVKNGTLLAPPNMEIVPMVVERIMLAKGVTADDVQVSLVYSKSKTLHGRYTLPKAIPYIFGGGSITGTHQLPDIYPTSMYDYELVPVEHGTLLLLSVVPLQYRQEIGDVTLYPELHFEIEVAEPVSLAFGGIFSVEFEKTDKTTGKITVYDIPNWLSEAVVSWTVNDGQGHVIETNRVSHTVEQGKNVTQEIDTSDWDHQDKFIEISVQSCDHSAPGGDLAVQLHDIEKTNKEDDKNAEQYEPLCLKDGEPDKTQKYLAGDTEATWTLGVYQDGCEIKKTTVPTRSFHLLIDGQEIDNPSVTKEGTVTYTVKLDLDTITYGNHNVAIRVIDDSSKAEGVAFWDLQYYAQGLRIIDKQPAASSIYTLTNTDNIVSASLVMEIQKDGNEAIELATGLTRDHFTLTVEGITIEKEKISVMEVATGTYQVTFPLTGKMLGNPYVFVHVRDDRGKTAYHRWTLQVDATDICFFRDCPTSPCASYELSEVLEPTVTLQALNSECKGQPTNLDTYKDDWYKLQLQPGDNLVANLTSIPKGANYDLILYTRSITNYFEHVAFSNNLTNIDETLVYTVPVIAETIGTTGTVALADDETTYYLRVLFTEWLPTEAENSYRLGVWTRTSTLFLPILLQPLPPAPACNHVEYSDIPNAMYPFSFVGTLCEATPSSETNDTEDWYWIPNVQAGQTLSVWMKNIRNGADYDLFLYGSDENNMVRNLPLSSSYHWGSVDEYFEHEITTAGNYYLQVQLKNKLESGNRYRLFVNLQN